MTPRKKPMSLRERAAHHDALKGKPCAFGQRVLELDQPLQAEVLEFVYDESIYPTTVAKVLSEPDVGLVTTESTIRRHRGSHGAPCVWCKAQGLVPE